MARFDIGEARRLALFPGLGWGVVSRIESLGLTRLSDLQRLGVDEVVRLVCAQQGSPGWANRRGALQRFLTSLDDGDPTGSGSLEVMSPPPIQQRRTGA